MAQFLLQAAHFFRAQVIIFLTAITIPVISNVIYLTGLSPWPHLKLTPTAFAVSGLAMALGVFWFHISDIVPVARTAAVDSMPDAVFVFDTRDHLVDLNPAGERIIGRGSDQVIGQTVDQVFAAQPDVLPICADGSGATKEVALRGLGNARHDVRISPVKHSRGGMSAGWFS